MPFEPLPVLGVVPVAAGGVAAAEDVPGVDRVLPDPAEVEPEPSLDRLGFFAFAASDAGDADDEDPDERSPAAPACRCASLVPAPDPSPSPPLPTAR